MFSFYAKKDVSGLEFIHVAKGVQSERLWESFILSAPGFIGKVRKICLKHGFDFSRLECVPQINDFEYFYFGYVETFENHKFFRVQYVIDTDFRYHPFDKVSKLAIFSKELSEPLALIPY